MKTTSAVSWRPLSELPDELREQAASDATIEIRRDGKLRSDRRWQLLMVPGLAGLVAGIMAGLLIPSGPLPSPVRLATLVVGAVSFGVWLAWFKGVSTRPLAGQGLLLTPSTLVIIDHTSVAVVRAENIDIDHGNLQIARELIHRADELFIDSLKRAQEADIEVRKSDPWRAFAGAAGGRPIPAPRTRPLGRAALQGLAVACVLELVFAVAIGWRSSKATARSWDRVDEVLGGQLDKIDRYQERAFVEKLAEAADTRGLVQLVEQAKELAPESNLRKRTYQRYRVALSDALRAAEFALEAEVELQYALQLELPEDDLAPIRERLAFFVIKDFGSSDEPDRIVEALEQLRRTNVEGEAKTTLLRRLAELADTTASSAGLDEASRLYASMANVVPSAHPMRSKLLARILELLRTELAAVSETRELYLRFAHVRRLVADPEVTALIDGRFVAIMQGQIASINDTSLLLDYYELRLNDELDAFLTKRYEEVARAEIKRARTAESIDHFRKEADVLGLSDEFKQLLEERIGELP